METTQYDSYLLFDIMLKFTNTDYNMLLIKTIIKNNISISQVIFIFNGTSVV